MGGKQLKGDNVIASFFFHDYSEKVSRKRINDFKLLVFYKQHC